MPDNYVDITVRAADSAKPDLEELKAKLNDLGRKVETARVNLAGDREAQAQLARIEAKLLGWGRRTETAKLKVDGVARAEADILGLDLALDALGRKSETAAASVGRGAGGLSGMSGMGALIGSVAVLSPVIATLGIGLAGLGAAAVGVAEPIMKAAKAAGGLRANLGTLDPEQRKVARGLLGLGQQYDKFSESLQPQILKVFGDGLKIASHLMADVEPVAKATGNALDGLLTRVDKEFQGGQWQSFFTFMAQNAGPDMKLLGDVLTNVLDSLPGLLEMLQPLAVDFLHVADGIAKVIDWGSKLNNLWTQQFPATAKGIAAAAQKARELGASQEQVSRFTRQATAALKQMGGGARSAADQVDRLAAAESDLTAAVGYASALVTQKNDAIAFAKAMKDSHDRIGLNTAAQRNSFSAGTQYISDLLQTAQQAKASGKGVAGQAAAIRGALPALEAAKTKSGAYWAELSKLKAIYDELRREADITKTVTINYRPGTVPGFTNPGPPVARRQGSAMVTGSPDGLAASVMGGAVAATATAERPFMAPSPYYGQRHITNQFIPLGYQPERHHITISNGAELIAVLAALLSQYARTHHGGSAQQAYGYGPG